LQFGYSLSHTPRGSTDLAEGPAPSIDSGFNFNATWQYQSDKYSTRLLYEAAWTDAQDNGVVERDFLDLQRQSLIFRRGYDFTTGTTAWLQPGYELVDYRQSRDDNGLVRNNQGWTLLAGLTIDRTAVMRPLLATPSNA
jgi:opacity protein-like surface antigen